MDEQTKINTSEAAGCLGSILSRAGMSFLANRVVIEQIAAGGSMVVFDKGSCAEVMAAEISRLEIAQTQHVMRVDRKRNDGPVAKPKADPYYRQFAKRW